MTVKVYADRKTPLNAGLTKIGRVTIRHAAIPKSRRLAVIQYIKRIAEKHTSSREMIGIKFSSQSVSLFVRPESDPKMLKYLMDKLHFALNLDVQNGKVIRK